jgi:hypothetical protein
VQKFKLKEIFSDIMKGYSYILLDDIIYIKHFNLYDAAEIDLYSDVFYQEALKRGLLKEEDKLQLLITKKIWDKEDEFNQAKDLITNMKQAKQNAKTWQAPKIEEEIKKKQDEYFLLLNERNNLLGKTAEDYVNKKIDEYYILASLYKDKELKTSLYDFDKFYDVDEDRLLNIIKHYNEKIVNFNAPNIKKISLFNNFTNLFHLCDNNAKNFFGKDVSHLTFYQAELFAYGRYFKSLMENAGKPVPEEIKEDPEKIEEWFEMTKNIEKTMDQANSRNSDGTVLFGQPKDLKKAGVESVNISEAVKKHGGQMNMKEIMKMQGYNIKT